MLFLKKSKAQGNKKGFSLSAHHRGEWDWGGNADWQLTSETSMAHHLKHKHWVFKLFRALQKHYGSHSNRVNSTLILVKDFWLEKMKCTCNFWALSCTPFPKVFLCFSLEQMFVTPKTSLRRLTRGEPDFPEAGDLLTGPQGSSTNRSRDPSAGCCPSCLLWILPSRFSKVGTLQSLSCRACVGVSSSPHLKFAWEMSADGVVLLFLNFDYGSQIKQIPFFLLKLAWFGFLSLFKN